MDDLLPIPLCLSERERQARAWDVVLANRGLILAVTWSMWGRTEFHSQQKEALHAEAEDALHEAALSYRPDRSKWSTYATHAIRNRQVDWRWRTQLVHVPKHRRRGEDRVDHRYEGFYESTKTVEPEEIEPPDELMRLRDAISRLPYREAKILRVRYCIPNPATLSVAAQMFGISTERVRQIEAKSIRQLRSLLT